MPINLTKRERATILAALRRWLSYPAARGSDSTATNGGKHKPLDDGEIDRLCERLAGSEMKRSEARWLRQSDKGVRDQKRLKARDDVRRVENANHLRLGNTKSQRRLR
jgi:hypothetical protein